MNRESGKAVLGLTIIGFVGRCRRPWLCIATILKSLTLLGLENETRALYRWLYVTYSSRRFPIMVGTFEFWSQAVS